MQQEFLYFTAGQFAALHHLKKRTLHYYDDIGLFSPVHKGENGYRYYTFQQSAELENILALRELGMSIEEIKNYVCQPNANHFQDFADQKIREIEEQIQRLNTIKRHLQKKSDILAFCDQIYDGKMEVRTFPKRAIVLTPMKLDFVNPSTMAQIMEHLQTAWEYNACKIGCGSYIALEKVVTNDFSIYDGLFTPVGPTKCNKYLSFMPAGSYLCGYCIGDWRKLPSFYQNMFTYAKEQNLELSGDCYEIGLNEFAISNMEEYVTQVEIPCKRLV